MSADPWQAHCLLTTEQTGAADRAAIAGGIPGIDLMEAAGAAVAREIRLRWRPRPAAILCGPGNNGGDGFVVARLLHEAGWPVAVLHAPQPARLPGDARAAFERWQAAAGGASATTAEWRADGADGAELIVDALFGAGLARPVEGLAAELLVRAAARGREAGIPLVAIDVPSGVDGNSGACLGPVAPARLTVAFVRARPGHYLLPARPLCGLVRVHDIGIPDRILAGLPAALAPRTALNAPALWRRALRPAAPGDHKYVRGHVLVVAGAMPGASVLAARAAARAGAGMVTVGWFRDEDGAIARVLDAHLPPSMLRQPMADAAALEAFCRERKVRALLAGQGFGRSAARRRRLAEIREIAVAGTFDADALPLPGAAPADRAEVLTPHDGEFARIEAAAGESDRDAGPDGGKVERARRAAARTGATIVWKGYDTAIAAPDGRVVVNPNGSPALATAGTGDVLAGTVAGLRAQGMPPFEAACAAVWCHAGAAQRCGPGLMADDLPDRLPDAMAAAFSRQGRGDAG